VVAVITIVLLLLGLEEERSRLGVGGSDDMMFDVSGDTMNLTVEMAVRSTLLYFACLLAEQKHNTINKMEEETLFDVACFLYGYGSLLDMVEFRFEFFQFHTLGIREKTPIV